MSTIGLCKDCKHWDFDATLLNGESGICVIVSWHKQNQRFYLGGAGSSFYSYLVTGPEHGCTEFEEREQHANRTV